MQQGRSPKLDVRPMPAIGDGVFELKDSDERAWYRMIYLARKNDIIFVLDCFEKDSRKTEKHDIRRARARFKQVRQRLMEERKMPNTSKPIKPGHITTGDILEDLGFSPQETIEAKVKSGLWRDLLVHIERRGVDQAYLKKALKIHQPDVSNLLRGKISKFSTGKLIQFAVRLNLDVRVELKEAATQKGMAASISVPKTRRRNRVLSHA